MRTVMERMGFAGAHKIETRFYVFYKDGMDEKFELVNVTLIPDKHYVKDYIDDPDGNPTRAFDEFYVNCIAKGIDIPWGDVI